MKLEIWCKRGRGLDGDQREIKAVLARIVVWDVVPRIGDWIIVWDGFCSEKVQDVHHSFDDNKCLVEIGSDCNGEYAKMAKSRNLFVIKN